MINGSGADHHPVQPGRRTAGIEIRKETKTKRNRDRESSAEPVPLLCLYRI